MLTITSPPKHLIARYLLKILLMAAAHRRPLLTEPVKAIEEKFDNQAQQRRFSVHPIFSKRNLVGCFLDIARDDWKRLKMYI